MKRYKVTLTTAADGSVIAYTPRLSGLLHSIEYVKPGSNGLDNGSTITVTDEATGKTLWTETGVNASAIRSPRTPTHSTAGAASLYASGGTAVNGLIPLANTRVKIQIASGGNAKNATFHILVD